MKKLNDEQKNKVIEGLKKVKQELSEEDIKEKMDNVILKEVNDEELEKVTGGASQFQRQELDPNKVILGWTYTELHDILCWVHEAYNDKNLTVSVANDYIPTGWWFDFLGYGYPAYFEQPMLKIWCSNELGV